MDTKSSVKDVIPDIGGNFQVDQSIVERVYIAAVLIVKFAMLTSCRISHWR